MRVLGRFAVPCICAVFHNPEIPLLVSYARGALPNFFFFFPCSADPDRDWPPCKVVFLGWQPINALRVRNNIFL